MRNRRHTVFKTFIELIYLLCRKAYDPVVNHFLYVVCFFDGV